MKSGSSLPFMIGQLSTPCSYRMPLHSSLRANPGGVRRSTTVKLWRQPWLPGQNYLGASLLTLDGSLLEHARYDAACGSFGKVFGVKRVNTRYIE